MHIISEYNTSSDQITYNGAVVTVDDALLILEGCRLGILPEVKRHLTGDQRNNINPYTVYAWDETACGMKRWTDGKTWLASRVQGFFLTYRELDSDKNIKHNGLVKQSFSVTTKQNRRLHVIAYIRPAEQFSLQAVPPPQQQLLLPYSVNPCANNIPPDVRIPSQDPQLNGIVPTLDIYPDSILNQIRSAPSAHMVSTQHPQPPYSYPVPQQPVLQPILQPMQQPVQWMPVPYLAGGSRDSALEVNRGTPPVVRHVSGPFSAASPNPVAEIRPYGSYGPVVPRRPQNRPNHDESALKALDRSFTNT